MCKCRVRTYGLRKTVAIKLRHLHVANNQKWVIALCKRKGFVAIACAEDRMPRFLHDFNQQLPNGSLVVCNYYRRRREPQWISMSLNHPW